jgi:Tol biopolymer transport system component
VVVAWQLAMANDSSKPEDSSAGSAPGRRLDSWKEIAAYFGRNERTVRRWERSESLPVHRHLHEKRGTVYAHTAELDAWWASRGLGLETQTQALPGSGRKWQRLIWGIAAMIGVVAIANVANRRMPRTERPSLPRTEARPLTSYPGSERYPSFAPDGNQVAFSWDGERRDNVDIYVKGLDVETPRRITSDPADDVGPAWSPDGRWISFLRLLSKGRSAVIVTPAAGGFERKLGLSAQCEGLTSLAAPVWSPDGKLLAVTDCALPTAKASIVLLSIETGATRNLTQPAAGDTFGDSNPAFRPDGRAIAYLRVRSTQAADIYVAPVGPEAGISHEPRRLTFDDRWIKGLDWTADGREIVFSSNRKGAHSLWKVPISGGPPEPLRVPANDATQPAVARRGNRLVFESRVRDTNIWRASTSKGSPPQRLIASTHEDQYPQYSPDGRFIVFESSRSGNEEIWMSDSEGSNQEPLTTMGSTAKTAHPRWSPDGRRIVFDSAPHGQRDIYVLNLDGGSEPHRLTTEPSHDVRPSWSRDGRWIYFGSSRTGRMEIWKAPAEGGTAVQVTRNGGHEAFESADGKHIYYVTEEVPSGLWMIPVSGGPERMLLSQGVRGFWALANNGVYFVGSPESDQTIEFFSFASQRREPLLSLPKGVRFNSGLGVSPDGRWLLYSQLDREESDIMLLENFR